MHSHRSNQGRVVMKRTNVFTLFFYFFLIVSVGTCVTRGQSAAGQGVATATGVERSSITLPMREGSIRLAVFGDAGRGSKDQYALGQVMADYRTAFPFDLVLLTGDNIYGPDGPNDMKNKFELPYKTLLDS